MKSAASPKPIAHDDTYLYFVIPVVAIQCLEVILEHKTQLSFMSAQGGYLEMGSRRLESYRLRQGGPDDQPGNETS